VRRVRRSPGRIGSSCKLSTDRGLNGARRGIARIRAGGSRSRCGARGIDAICGGASVLRGIAHARAGGRGGIAAGVDAIRASCLAWCADGRVGTGDCLRRGARMGRDGAYGLLQVRMVKAGSCTPGSRSILVRANGSTSRSALLIRVGRCATCNAAMVRVGRCGPCSVRIVR
jgi:hypothetical protein